MSEEFFKQANTTSRAYMTNFYNIVSVHIGHTVAQQIHGISTHCLKRCRLAVSNPWAGLWPVRKWASHHRLSSATVGENGGSVQVHQL